MTVPSSRHSNTRRPPWWVIGVTVLTALALAAAAYIVLKPLEAPIPDDAGLVYTELPQGTTDDGFPRLGQDDAPIVIEEFSSYACSHCREFHETRLPDLLPAIAAGQVQYVVISVPHIGPGSRDAARAALCAGEQGRYWAMHDVLFSWQKQFLTRTFATKRIEQGAANLGLDADAFQACFRADRTTAQIDLAQQRFTQRGLTGTPSFFMNGQKVLDYREFDFLTGMSLILPQSSDSPR